MNNYFLKPLILFLFGVLFENGESDIILIKTDSEGNKVQYGD